MDGEGKVECCTSCGHRLDFPLGGKDEYLRGKEVQLDGVEEVHCVRLRVVQDFLDGAEPVVQLVLVLREFGLLAVLVFPVGGKALLCHLVHAVRAYLHLNPSSLLRHQCDVQSLIAVCLGV